MERRADNVSHVTYARHLLYHHVCPLDDDMI